MYVWNERVKKIIPWEKQGHKLHGDQTSNSSSFIDEEYHLNKNKKNKKEKRREFTMELRNKLVCMKSLFIAHKDVHIFCNLYSIQFEICFTEKIGPKITGACMHATLVLWSLLCSMRSKMTTCMQ